MCDCPLPGNAAVPSPASTITNIRSLYLTEIRMRDGQEASVSLSNGISVQTDRGTFRLDPGRTVQGEVNFISHAHADHLPRGGDELSVVSTRKTLELAEHRTGKKFTLAEDRRVALLDAGHVPGSAMALIEDGRRFLYTGDFCTRRKVYLEPARAVKTDILLIESTYALPRYSFPDPLELSGVIRDWVSDALASGNSVFFTVYPLGKAQEVETLLRGLPLCADASVQAHNRIVFGDCGEWIGDIGDARGESVFICSSRSSLSKLRPGLKSGMLFATVSGWSVDDWFRRCNGLDEAFPLSDHCDHDDLLSFVRECDPDVVYTMHGFAEEFAEELRRDMQIEAHALSRRSGRQSGGRKQKKLDTF